MFELYDNLLTWQLQARKYSRHILSYNVALHGMGTFLHYRYK